MYKNTISTTALLAVTVACMAASAASAEGEGEDEWEISGGFAVGAAQAYEGSSSYSVIAFPYLNLKWRDTISFGFEGLEAKLFKGDAFEAGAGLTYDSGREEDGDLLFGSSGDDRLLGLGDVDSATGIRLFGRYDLGPAVVGAETTRYLGNDNDGTTVSLGLGKQIVLSKTFFLTPRIEATWADENYMDTFFGVTRAQSNRSRLPAFEAEAGVKHLSLNVTAVYRLDSKWYFTVNTGVQQLLNAAADSPISAENISFNVFSSLGYRF